MEIGKTHFGKKQTKPELSCQKYVEPNSCFWQNQIRAEA